MQDRYFGDVGDFGKYGLLRILCGSDSEQALRLGVVWYLYPDESHNADGKHVGYLLQNDRVFRNCDEQLYDKLRGLLLDEQGQIITANRSTTTVEKLGLLPDDSVFFSLPLSYPKNMQAPARSSLREEWFASALTATASSDLVFLDPDNGIECTSVKRTSSKGPKYVFWDDITRFIERGQSLVVYHHLNRTRSHREQVNDILEQMNRCWGTGISASAVTFTRGTNRAYFVIASSKHTALLDQRLERIRSGIWNQHFR